jgi:SAM-dependent methyltransferase
VKSSFEDPWLTIPLSDYEGHMEAVGQSAVLRRAFADAYEAIRPRRLAVLGCTSGADFDAIDPAVTEHAVGVDINPDYLKAAETRTAGLRARIEYLRGDVLNVSLPMASFDLVHAALLLEYVDPRSVFRRTRDWLRPSGHFSIVTQEPVAGLAAVSSSRYTSLQALASRLSPRSSDELLSEASLAGMVLASKRATELPNGKVLLHSVFTAARTTQRDVAAAEGSRRK